MRASYRATTHTSLEPLAARWDGLHESDNPFISSVFLAALEAHGAVANELGWQALHIALESGHELLAAAPGYLTTHSFGDFVYDWHWARQAELAGYNWYPKWVFEVPYSPVTGPRLLTAAGDKSTASLLIQGIQQLAEQHHLQCVQVNYCTAAEAGLLARAGFLINTDVQFHWQHAHEQDFEGHLMRLRNKRRKEIRRERRKVQAQNISHRWINGLKASAGELQFAYRCYQKTFHDKGNYPALNHAFWHTLARQMGEQLLLCLAYRHELPIACAIFLRCSKRLYGRYWGCLEEFDCLHFETCYYQGIEYCLAHGLQAFEPGAGGSHKLQRGFMPATIFTAHWFPDARLRSMMAANIQAQQALGKTFTSSCSQDTPFKRA